MTRMIHLLTAFAVAAGCAGVAMTACGGRPTPSEMPPLAPQPDTVRPNALPMTRAVSGSAPAAQPSPVYQASSENQPLGGQPSPSPTPPSPGAAVDAGVSDSGTAPLPPLRDGSVPADSRMEPILQRDGGR